MFCPHCQSERLVPTDRRGIEIDFCPSCRGVWLDRGELEKLIERTSSYRDRDRDDEDDDDRDRRFLGHDRDDHRSGKRRRRGFLGELFDFG